MDGTITRTRMFGIAMIVYSLLSMLLIVFDSKTFTFDMDKHGYVLLGGLLIVLGGAVIAYKSDFDKMYAIGIYAITFGIFKIFKAYSTYTMDLSNFDFLKIQISDLLATINIILAISFILLGISFMMGKSKKIVSKVCVSIVFILINIGYLKSFWDDQDWMMVAMFVTEIIVLALFIVLLLSKDVRINTVEAKEKYGKKISKDAKKQADADYAEAKKQAAEAKKEGKVEEAAAIMAEAKKERKETIAEGKKLAKDAKKVRYVYNPETKKVEVMKEGDGKTESVQKEKTEEPHTSDKDNVQEEKPEEPRISSKDKLELARKKLDEESEDSKE